MAGMVTNLNVATRARLCSMSIPREHGAWGLLLVPLVIGGVVGLHSGAHSTETLPSFLALAVAALSLFWLRTPVEALLGTTPIKARSPEERSYLAVVIAGLSALAAICLAIVFWGGRNQTLLPIGIGAATAFALQALVKRLGRKGRMPAQIIGSIGLTSTAAAAFCVANGAWNASALMLWTINFFFATDQIHYVQVKIHSSRCADRRALFSQGKLFLLGQFCLFTVPAAGSYFAYLPLMVMLAFAPVLLRGFLLFVRRPAALNVHRLGWTELVNSVAFGVLMCAAYWTH